MSWHSNRLQIVCQRQGVAKKITERFASGCTRFEDIFEIGGDAVYGNNHSLRRSLDD